MPDPDIIVGHRHARAVPGIHVFTGVATAKTWMAGQGAEATPSFGRLCPAMTSPWRRYRRALIPGAIRHRM